MADRSKVLAWRPRVDGIAEVFHADLVDHSYPRHAHDNWTLLLVDRGAIRYDLERRGHTAPPSQVILLPPHIAHNGSPATGNAFRKRVLYLLPSLLDDALIGAAVDQPHFADTALHRHIHLLHGTLRRPGDEFEAESRLTLIRSRLLRHLRRSPTPPRPARNHALAHQLRALLDADLTNAPSLREASTVLQTSPAHLVRSFSSRFGIPPHKYLTGKRIELARSRLLDGENIADVAINSGFYDQAHLTRHFRRMTGVNPAHYAAISRRSSWPR